MTAPETADLIERLEKRLEGPGLIVALAKDEAQVLLSAAREGERLREGLRKAAELYTDLIRSGLLYTPVEDEPLPPGTYYVGSGVFNDMFAALATIEGEGS